MIGKPGNLYLTLEFATLYLGLPFAVWYALSSMHLLIIPVLLCASLMCLGLLLRDPEFDMKRVWNLPGLKTDIWRILTMFLMTSMAIAAIVWLTRPESFFDLPRRHTAIWGLIMVFYPVISVPPQELIYRVFLFHRYRSILRTPEVTILVSAVTDTQ